MRGAFGVVYARERKTIPPTMTLLDADYSSTGLTGTNSIAPPRDAILV